MKRIFHDVLCFKFCGISQKVIARPEEKHTFCWRYNQKKLDVIAVVFKHLAKWILRIILEKDFKTRTKYKGLLHSMKYCCERKSTLSGLTSLRFVEIECYPIARGDEQHDMQEKTVM